MQLDSISLADFLASKPVTYLWVNRVIGGALEFSENTASDGEDYCPQVDEIAEQLDILDLEGEVVDGRWEWLGKGWPTDWNGTSIVHVIAGHKG